VRALVLLIGLWLAAPAGAQAIVTSPAPDRVAVTVYRDPGRGIRPFNLGWLQGYALVSETRRIRLPAGTSEVRFEGVTSGIVPQSAIVTGLGEVVLEKNRDARLLSPGSLLDANLGERLMLRRTSKATGQVRQQEAIVRATADGVVVQTEQGFEALRCTGLKETLLAPSVPAGLSAKPTLSVRIRSAEPVEREVTLSYITNNFDWQADYVGELSADGRNLSLFAWMTIANGDDTGLADAATQAVAGKLNREYASEEPSETTSVRLECWPNRRTHEIPEEGEAIVVTGASMRRKNAVTIIESVVADEAGVMPAPAAIMAQQESLGDLKLYRIPINVTVSARSQKQVAMIHQPAVKVESLLRLRVPQGSQFEGPLDRILVTRNRTSEGLGLPLPAGKLALFGMREGRRILIGEGRIDDHTIGEKVEIRVATASGVRATQVHELRDGQGGAGGDFLLTLTNDSPQPQTVEIELPLEARAHGLTKGDGYMIWRVQVPANGRSQLRYSVAT
jgi:hypothetical protein